MVRSVRSLLFVVLMSQAALAAPVAQLATDVDGDGATDQLELESGRLLIKAKNGTTKIEVGDLGKAKLAAAVVNKVPTVVISGEKEGVILQLAGGGWKQVVRTPIGPQGVDGRSEEHTSELQSRGLISYAVFCLKKN